MRWPQSDPRWELYHSGELGEPFDILGVYEEADGELAWRATDEHDTSPVDPMDVLDATIRLLGECDNRRRSIAKRLQQSAQHNKDLQEKRKRDMIDDAEHGVRLERPRLGKGGKRRRHVAVGKDLSEGESNE